VTRRLLLTCVALLLALTGCAAAPGSAPAGAALDFTGADLDGAPFDAAELAGTPVVLWFWAPF
jgi:cytochrome oxidase Cu insertion factor (SCO1/SenC/PrrC family)